MPTRKIFYLSSLLRHSAAFVFFPVPPGFATPFDWGDKIVKPPRFPKDSTINVFIKKDPKNKGRDALVKEGVERWKQTLAARGIDLNADERDVPRAGAHERIADEQAPAHVTLEVGQAMGPAVGAEDAGVG
jgi:hypothetical protein